MKEVHVTLRSGWLVQQYYLREVILRCTSTPVHAIFSWRRGDRAKGGC